METSTGAAPPPPPPPPPYQHADASRPSLGFPLGTALLLLIVFSLSGIFSCCYHRDKLRRSFSSHHPTDLEAQHPDYYGGHTKPKQQVERQSLPVLMPGDEMPKFIAMPCPCQPPRQDTSLVTAITTTIDQVEVHQKPPKLPPTIPLPPY